MNDDLRTMIDTASIDKTIKKLKRKIDTGDHVVPSDSSNQNDGATSSTTSLVTESSSKRININPPRTKKVKKGPTKKLSISQLQTRALKREQIIQVWRIKNLKL